MTKISDKQEEMLAFIEEFVTQNGYPPTYEEIRAGLNISTKSLVNYHLAALENARLLTRVPNTPRGIRLTGRGAAVQLPLKTNGGAGSPLPIPAMSQADVLELTLNCVNNPNHVFALSGNTVADEFLADEDIVILQGRHQAQNGEVVAVRLPKQGCTTLKRYFRENGHVRLQSTGSTLEEVIANPSDVEIQGRVVAVIRQAA